MASGAKVFVGCLPYSKIEADLEELFNQCGAIKEVFLQRKPDGSSKGAAFVTYESAESASTAVERLNGYLWPDSPRGINVSLAGSGASSGSGTHPVRTSPRPPAAPAFQASQWGQPTWGGPVHYWSPAVAHSYGPAQHQWGRSGQQWNQMGRPAAPPRPHPSRPHQAAA